MTARSQHGVRDRGEGRQGSRVPPVGEERTVAPPPDSRVDEASLPGRIGRWIVFPLILVLTAYGASALIVPTMTPAPVSDDWVYMRSVEILVRQHRLHILDLSVVTLVFQVFWGALFAKVFGLTFGALRLSTVALTFLGGWALYGLCREMGVDRRRGVLGAALYLFNPLAFVLSFSFMSDPQFTALLIVAAFFFVRGTRRPAPAAGALLAGSVVTALAFLVRQQGILLLPAVLGYLLVARRLRPDRIGLLVGLRVAAIPALTVLLYYGWLFFIHGVPSYQGTFAREVGETGWGGGAALVCRMVYIAMVYVGFFTLPLAAGVLVSLRRLVHLPVPVRAGWFVLWTLSVVTIAVGFVVFAQQDHDRAMPYVPQFLGVGQLGPRADLLGVPPVIAPAAVLMAGRWVLTVACALASLVFALALVRAIDTPPSPEKAAGYLVVSIAVWQWLGVLPPSFHFRSWAGSLDRYLLPLLPLAICLGLWAVRDLRLSLPLAWVLVVLFALFAVAGTRDFLVFQGATWDLARHANELGIADTQLDAGASWDGFHLYEYGHDNNIPPQTSQAVWWIDLFAPATDSSYVVAQGPLANYTIVERVEYSSWLHRRSVSLYLLRHIEVCRSGICITP